MFYSKRRRGFGLSGHCTESIGKGTTIPVSNSAKFDVIRFYLRQQFPKHHIADFQEGTSRAQVFRVDAPQGHPLHYAVLGLDFLLDQTAESLQQTLLSSGLGDKLKEAGAAPVTVSKTGFSTEGTIAAA